MAKQHSTSGSLFTAHELGAMSKGAAPVPTLFDSFVTYFGIVLPAAEAELAFERLFREAPWAKRTLQLHGKVVEMPRDIAWFGAHKDQGVYAAEARAWPEYLLPLKELVEERTGFSYTGCLCNLYRDGTNSVAWHSDHEAVGGAVASLSLGDTRVFRMRDKKDHGITQDFPLPSGALLLMRPGCQEVTEHCVPKTKRPVGPRINLTFRQVR